MELLDPIKREILVGQGSTRITIRHFTDIHKGSEGHESKLWHKAIGVQERDPQSYCILTGDLTDRDRGSMRDRKAKIHAEEGRKDAWIQQDKADMSWLKEFILPDLKRIAPRCLGYIDGDHFMRLSNGDTSGQWLCKQARIPYIGERAGFVVVRFFTTDGACYSYPIFARHGVGGTASSGSSVNALERQNALNYRAHLYLGGHNHREDLHPVKVEEPNRNGDKINRYVAWYMRGGSFVNPAYAKKAEYNPQPTGWGEVELTVHRIKNPAGGTGKNSRLLIAEARKASMVAE